MVNLECITRKSLIKYSTLGYVTDWSPVPSGRTLSIETRLSWLLALEPSLCAWTMGTWFPSVPGYLTDGLSVLRWTLYLTTRSSPGEWVSWTYGNSDPLILPTTFPLDFLKCVNCSSSVNHSSSNYWSSYWSNMTWIFEFLNVTIIIQTSGSVTVLPTTVENM